MGQVTIGTETYEVYGTEAEFKIYMAGHMNSSAYDNATPANMRKSMVSGTRWIERANWGGQKTDLVTPQPLEFPRTGLTDKDGNEVDSANTPTEVEYACYELNLILLSKPKAMDAINSGSNIKKVEAGDAKVTFFKSTFGSFPKFPNVVNNLIGLYLDGAYGRDFGAAYGANSDGHFSGDSNFPIGGPY